MTLREGADIVRGRLYGGFVPADARVSERRAMLEILIQRDTFVQTEMKASGELWEATPEMFVMYGGDPDEILDADQSKWLIPTMNTFLNRYMIELPTPPLPLRNDRGIDLIYPVGFPQEAYIRISSDMETQAYQVSQGMEGNVTWKLTPFNNNKIVEFPNMTPSKLPSRLVIKMIPTSQAAMFQNIGEGDRISLPGRCLGDSERFDGILTRAYKILLTLDDRRDSAPDEGEKKS